ncbi:MAG: 50S ribosome-binding GTPase [Verrucomicrobiales bacterium]|nr:50S ribosome-binding GTPase [Verrucomicrobiales bacterium]
MFVDEVKVYARAGHGGKGCIAFLREAYRPKGGPDGGNGGRGGDVILEADHDLNNLIHQFYQPRLLAANGEHGMGKGMDGHAGKDLVVKVPCGTLVWRCATDDGPPVREPAQDSEDDAEAEEAEDSRPPKGARGAGKEPPGVLRAAASGRPVIRHAGGIRALEVELGAEEPDQPRTGGERELVADLTEHGQRFILCKGGRGGLGNRNFANSVRQTPRFAQPGEPGHEGDYVFELRMIADVGLVGFPNAGKSTLLAAISKARPKIAAYPFTTLTPQIGIVECTAYRRLVVCDVPGLIEGAHRNVGLGHAFLRHIARCKVLVVVLDMAGADGRAPWDDYRQLLTELELHDASLLERRRLVVSNKMDEAAAVENLKKFKRRVPKTPVIQMAAGFGEGIDTFKAAILEAVDEAAQLA